MSFLYCCEVCDTEEPTWRIHREDGVTHSPKQVEWASIKKALTSIARDT